MGALKIINADNREHAYETASSENVRILAGGTDILGGLYDHIHRSPPDGLVNIKTLGLDYMREDEEGVVIGAGVRLSDIEKSGLLKERYPLLADAARTVASPQIRNMATVGGNICQEPRCWYYRHQDNKFDCLRKGGAVCPAFTGNNPYHSILGSVRICETGCQAGCPNETSIGKYMEQIRRGDIEGAARTLFEVNPIAAVTGRVCPHTCMSDCARNEFDEAVSIRAAERFLGDYIMGHADDFFTAPDCGVGMSVAVVGAGPAGLTAAYYLRLSGLSVTVFDTHEEAGGMLRYSIPAYRLPRGIIRKTKSALEKTGVVFRLGADCNAEATVADYRKRFDAVFVGTGAQLPLPARIEGEEHCLNGLEFLYNVSVEKQAKPGDDVLVIGGGDVAMDVAVTAKRLGAKNVTLVYRRPKELMPAHDEEKEQAFEEGVAVAESLAPVGVVLENGKVAGLDVAASRSGEGRDSKAEIDMGERKVLKADCVVLAIGQEIDGRSYEGVLDADEKKRIKTDDFLSSSMDGVYAGGDAVLGPGTVVWAIAHGRRAAGSIIEYLNLTPTRSLFRGESGEADDHKTPFDPSALSNSDAAALRLPNVEERALYREDISEGLDAEAVMREAARCFNCGCVAVSASDLAPALVALSATIHTNMRVIPASEFFGAGICSATNLSQGEIVMEIHAPAPEKGSFMEYRKFRPRRAIDFPVLSTAVYIERSEGVVKNAKIVLGAAGPLPYEAIDAAAYLKGRKIDETVAATAATLALKGAVPLAENGYKVKIAKALVRRSVLAAASNRQASIDIIR
ncbi:MAG: FAD-dependent oxidoreductase [Clostridiales Family XIII bacterium]|jgi:NADPH-dependent glutamate synthase beta subunit-like oxidoreductase|nr:FAD-dependent oxidoreductase [Clostridiales Family XIII bacterium]